MSSSLSPLYKHIPYKIRMEEDKPLCYWLYANDKPFIEPFFHETIGAIKSSLRTSNLNSVSSLQMLEDWGGAIDAVEPTAFIFHVSRCGSTLLAQLLGTDKQNIVLSEVPFFDALLRLPYQTNDVSKDEINILLKSAVEFYGQKRTGNEKQLFIKLDSWHICFYKQLRELYPNVPFILLYRKPDEVLHSHRKLRGMQAVPGIIEPQVFGFDHETMVTSNLDAYLATVLERYLEEFIKITATDPLSMLLNYNEGITVMMEKFASFTGITFNRQQLAAMQERSKYHSKNREQVFAEEYEEKIDDCLTKAMALYEHTEQMRLQQAGRLGFPEKTSVS